MSLPNTLWRLEPAHPHLALPRLVPGEVYDARVEHCSDQGRAKIRIAESLVCVGHQPGLRSGDQMVLRLDRLWPTIVFRMLVRKNKVLGTIEVNT